MIAHAKIENRPLCNCDRRSPAKLYELADGEWRLVGECENYGEIRVDGSTTNTGMYFQSVPEPVELTITLLPTTPAGPPKEQ